MSGGDVRTELRHHPIICAAEYIVAGIGIEDWHITFPENWDYERRWIVVQKAVAICCRASFAARDMDEKTDGRLGLVVLHDGMNPTIE